MKFKYKKMIIAITMCTMCIGMVTISLISPVSSTGKESTKQEKNVENKLAKLNDDAELIDEAGIKEEEGELEISKEEELNNLVASYLNCRLTGDKEKLGEIVTDINDIDMGKLEKLRMLISEYRNIECYIVETKQKGNYIVYIYYEILFSGAETPVSGLDHAYVITDPDGKLKLNFGVVPKDVQELMEESRKSEKVQKMIETVNYKVEEAISKDEKLREIYANLNGGTDYADSNASSEKNEGQSSASVEPTNTSGTVMESEQPKETDEPLENTEAVRE